MLKSAATLLERIRETPLMPTTSVKNDARYEKAARRWLEIPALKCPEVMKISGFSAEEVKNNTICQRVRRMKASIEESIERGLIPPIVASLPKSKDSDCSPLTDDTSLSVSKKGSSTTSAASLPSNNSLKKKLGVKQIRKTSVQAHQNRVNKKRFQTTRKKRSSRRQSYTLVRKKKRATDGVQRGARIMSTKILERMLHKTRSVDMSTTEKLESRQQRWVHRNQMASQNISTSWSPEHSHPTSESNKRMERR